MVVSKRAKSSKPERLKTKTLSHPVTNLPKKNFKRSLLQDGKSAPSSPSKVVAKRTSYDSGVNDDSDCDAERNEGVIVSGKWDTSQSVPEIEVQGVDLHSSSDDSGVCWANDETEDSGIQNSHSDETFCEELDFSQSTYNLSGILSSTGRSDGSETLDENDLSWLMNFKVDSIFKSTNIEHDHSYRGNEEIGNICGEENPPDINIGIKKNSLATGRVFLSDSNGNVRKMKSQHEPKPKPSYGCQGPKKPPYTYTELIEQALSEKGQLTVSGIYQWISDRFPYYKANDDRWKNSVRHNLSINPHFRKGSKAPQGAGHLWTVTEREDSTKAVMQKRQRMNQYMSNVVTLEEIRTATASIEDNKENRSICTELLFSLESETPMLSSTTDALSLEQSAEEILTGVKKNVEVQYVLPFSQQPPSNTDFLNPLSQEVIVQESGLLERIGDINGSYLITDLNPVTLGINMGDSEVVLPETLFAEDMGLQCYEVTSSAQLPV